MVSYGSSWLVGLLCVFWLSHDLLKVASQSSETAAASLMSVLGVNGGRSVGEKVTEADVIAMQEACRKALDVGLGADAPCQETDVSLLKLPKVFVLMVTLPVEEILSIPKFTKEEAKSYTAKAGKFGGSLCSVKDHLVCVGGSCKDCGDLTASQKEEKVINGTCGAAAAIAPRGDQPTEDEVTALRKAVLEGLEGGKAAGVRCASAFVGTTAGNLANAYAGIVQSPVWAIMMSGKYSKNNAKIIADNAGENLGKLCSLKKKLVCKGGSCKVCGVKEEGDEKLACNAGEAVRVALGLKEEPKDEKEEPQEEEASGGGWRRGCSGALMSVGIFACLCAPILRSLFFT